MTGPYRITDPTREQVAAYYRQNISGCRKAWKTKRKLCELAPGFVFTEAIELLPTADAAPDVQ
jgi:hypothetical protein